MEGNITNENHLHITVHLWLVTCQKLKHPFLSNDSDFSISWSAFEWKVEIRDSQTKRVSLPQSLSRGSKGGGAYVLRSLARSLTAAPVNSVRHRRSLVGPPRKERERGREERTGGGRGQENECRRSPRSQCPTQLVKG